jgi:hypothetical protein
LPEPVPVEKTPPSSGPGTAAEGGAPLTVDESSGTPNGNGTADLPPGAVERYELRGEVGRGGIGLVLRGHDPRLERDLALKVLLFRHAGHPEVVRRFVEEAQISGQLQHPGVVPVYDLGQCDDGRPFFTMKLVKGRTLARLLAERPDPERERPRFLKIFEQVCQTVAYAHSRGVIHRDLKPANVMVGAFGEVQVMDWGLAKVLGQSEEAPAAAPTETVSVLRTLRTGLSGSDSQPGSVLGTPTYMAPEQALGEVERLDRRCDVFGLGAVLCEVLTGQPPYVGPDREAVHRQAARADLADAFARLAGCGADGEVVALARRCLAAEPSERPADAKQVAEAIAAHLAGVEERLREAELQRAQAEVQAREERKRRKLVAGLAAALLLLLTGGSSAAWWWQQQRAERQAEADRQRLAFEADLDQIAAVRRRERWAEARAVLERARQRIGAGGPEDVRAPGTGRGRPGPGGPAGGHPPEALDDCGGQVRLSGRRPGLCGGVPRGGPGHGGGGGGNGGGAASRLGGAGLPGDGRGRLGVGGCEGPEAVGVVARGSSPGRPGPVAGSLPRPQGVARPGTPGGTGGGAARRREAAGPAGAAAAVRAGGSATAIGSGRGAPVGSSASPLPG